jgi:hypothetical protein
MFYGYVIRGTPVDDPITCFFNLYLVSGIYISIIMEQNIYICQITDSYCDTTLAS